MLSKLEYFCQLVPQEQEYRPHVFLERFRHLSLLLRETSASIALFFVVNEHYHTNPKPTHGTYTSCLGRAFFAIRNKTLDVTVPEQDRWNILGDTD